MPASTAFPPGFLPAPRIPGGDLDRSAPPLDELRRLGLDDSDLASLVAVDDARAAARRAVEELEAARPGGTTWAAALDADKAALASKHKRGNLSELARGEWDRYSTAHARCRLVSDAKRVARADETLRTVVEAAAVAEVDAALETFTAEAEAGWLARSATSTAWAHRERAEEALLRWGRAKQCRDWARGRLRKWVDPAWLGTIPGGAPGGHYLALKRYLDGGGAWLTLPQGFEWPHDFDATGAEATGQGLERLRTRGNRPVAGNDASRRLLALDS